ncbi:MAG: c-type cytochrome [Anaerolineales bacterium]|jgi:mono/diheme cytochrome c family protein
MMTRLQLEIALGTILVLATAVLLVMFGLNENTRMARFEQEQQAHAIEVGAGLFETNCSGCHGLKGEGIPGLCPPLNDRHFFTDRLAEVGWPGSLEDYIIATVSSGRLTSTRPDQYAGQGKPAMPTWSDQLGGPLREDQIRDIATFIMNWQATALEQVTLTELPTPTPRPEELNDPVARGQQVFLNSGCTGCHTINGLSAGTVGPNLTQIGTTAETRVEGQSAEEYIRQSILMPNEHIVEGFPQNVMPQNFGELLSQDQLNDLVSFLLAQK